MLADTFRTHKQKNAVGLLGPDFEAELCNTHNPRNVASGALLAGHRGVEHIFESLERSPGSSSIISRGSPVVSERVSVRHSRVR